MICPIFYSKVYSYIARMHLHAAVLHLTPFNFPRYDTKHMVILIHSVSARKLSLHIIITLLHKAGASRVSVIFCWNH